MTPTEPGDDLWPLLRDIARPALLWAAHFILAYATLSAACAPRGLIGPLTATIIVIVAAIPAAGWSLKSVFGGNSSELGRAARWSGLISAIAIVFNAAPVILMRSCG